MKQWNEKKKIWDLYIYLHNVFFFNIISIYLENNVFKKSSLEHQTQIKNRNVKPCKTNAKWMENKVWNDWWNDVWNNEKKNIK